MKKLMVMLLLLVSANAFAWQIGASFKSLSEPGKLNFGWTGDHKAIHLSLSGSLVSNTKSWEANPGFAFKRYGKREPWAGYWGFGSDFPMSKRNVFKVADSYLLFGIIRPFTFAGAAMSLEMEFRPVTVNTTIETTTFEVAFNTHPAVSFGLNYLF